MPSFFVTNGRLFRRSDNGLSIAQWPSVAAYKEREQPDRNNSWASLAHVSVVLDPLDEIEDPGFNAPPEPDPKAVALADLAVSDAGMARVVDDLAAWAKTQGWTPPEAVEEKLDARETLRSVIRG